MIRREFVKLGAAAVLAPAVRSCSTRSTLPAPAPLECPAGVYLNDIHSQLNGTWVDVVVRPTSHDELRSALAAARTSRRAVSVAGGRHSMGGQQFGSGTVSLDMRGMGRILHFDDERGTIEVEAGIEWPELLGYLWGCQEGRAEQWGIRQKQTGADRLSLGGALASNVHGRGLRLPPIVSDVEAFTLVDAHGEVHTCSRDEDPELFRLAIGGYGSSAS